MLYLVLETQRASNAQGLERHGIDRHGVDRHGASTSRAAPARKDLELSQPGYCQGRRTTTRPARCR